MNAKGVDSMTDRERKNLEDMGLLYPQAKEDVPMIPQHQAETMMMHMEIANRNMMLVAVTFAAALVSAIIIFVNGYTARTKDWLNTLATLQNRTTVTEVEADGIQQQPSP